MTLKRLRHATVGLLLGAASITLADCSSVTAAWDWTFGPSSASQQNTVGAAENAYTLTVNLADTYLQQNTNISYGTLQQMNTIEQDAYKEVVAARTAAQNGDNAVIAAAVAALNGDVTQMAHVTGQATPAP